MAICAADENDGSESASKMQEVEERLSDALEWLDRANQRSEDAEKELERWMTDDARKVDEVEEVRDELGRREHDVVRVELQLEQVRSAVQSSEEARLQAEARCNDARYERDQVIAALEETSMRVIELEASGEAKVGGGSDENDDHEKEAEESRQRRLQEGEENAERTAKLERQVEDLRAEKERAVLAAEEARTSRDAALAERETRLASLRNEVDVQRRETVGVKVLLEEREAELDDLREEVGRANVEGDDRLERTEEDLAAKRRELAVATVELEERGRDVERLEEMLKTVRKDAIPMVATPVAASVAASIATPLRIETGGDEVEDASDASGDGQEEMDIMSMPPISPSSEQSSASPLSSPELSSSALPSPDHHAAAATATAAAAASAAAEKELQINRLERELGTHRRQLEAARAEVEERDKIVERLRNEVQQLRTAMLTKARQYATKIEEMNEVAETLRRDVEARRLNEERLEERLRAVGAELEGVTVRAAAAAEEAGRCAEVEEERRTTAEAEAQVRCEGLEEELGELRTIMEEVETERDALAVERDEVRESSLSFEAEASDAAERLTEKESQIERMQREIDFKKREIDTIKAELQDKDRISKRLMAEVEEVRKEKANYVEQVQSEKEQEALQKIAKREYFDDELSVTSEHTDFSMVSTGASAAGGRSMFKRLASKVSPKGKDTVEGDPDARIDQLENTVAMNEATIDHLRTQLVTVTSKFKLDEHQRRLLIQNLENENSAYSIKLEVLENEFNEFNKTRQNPSASTLAGSGSGMDYDGVSAFSNFSGMDSSVESGMSGMDPLEKENRTLKKQKNLYENRISSLQMQLSEIQKIVPELMSKSKSQIQKLEGVIQTQKQDAERNEEDLRDEIAELRKQNEQLQAATRSRLQASDADRQDELDQLRARLDERETTIEEMNLKLKSKSRGSILKRKKGKKKKKGTSDEASQGSISTTGQSTGYSTYSYGARSAYSTAAKSVGASSLPAGFSH